MDYVPFIPCDEYAAELAEDINFGYCLKWTPEYVQYLSTKVDPELDRFELLPFLILHAEHEQLTANV